MSLIKFLDHIDTKGFDKESKEKFLSRKDALNKMGTFGKNMALSALPLGALATFSSPEAQAQSSDDFIAVLNYALTLELLEATYYNMGIEAGVIASNDMAVFQQIAKHEDAHVNLLQTVISDTLDGDPLTSDDVSFDFTASGAFDPFNNYAQYMALSQAFEDTGVRAYKGQAGNAQANADILTAALRIHSVEARHASQVRRMRGSKGWITQDNGIQGVSQANAVYDGEDNATQVVSVESTLSGNGDVSVDNITEAWDEPLDMEAVNGIASLFLA